MTLADREISVPPAQRRKSAGRRSLTGHFAKVRIAGSSPVARSSKSRSKSERQRTVTGSIPVSPPQRRTTLVVDKVTVSQALRVVQILVEVRSSRF
jgi:hypothetical protein